MGTAPILFAGPSLCGLTSDILAHIDVRPPVRRGDIDQVVEGSKCPGVIVIADGMFHDYPSVGHAELRRAIQIGWQVWGVSSMGAIRAAEMQTFGMRGFGRVFERFANDPNYTDDEVALLHLGEPPYIMVTEPLIHVRGFLEEAHGQGRITVGECLAILNELQARWFGYRTLHLLEGLLQKHSSWSKEFIAEELRSFHRYRTKNHDLKEMLQARPWCL